MRSVFNINFKHLTLKYDDEQFLKDKWMIYETVVLFSFYTLNKLKNIYFKVFTNLRAINSC